MSYTLTVATLPKLCETGQQGRKAKKAQAANCCVRVITDKSPPQATSGLWTKFNLQLIKAKKKIKDKESNHLAIKIWQSNGQVPVLSFSF